MFMCFIGGKEKQREKRKRRARRRKGVGRRGVGDKEGGGEKEERRKRGKRFIAGNTREMCFKQRTQPIVSGKGIS